MKSVAAFLAISLFGTTTAAAELVPYTVPPGYVLHRCDATGLLLVGSDKLILPGALYAIEHRRLSTGVLVFETGSFNPMRGELTFVLGDKFFRMYCSEWQAR